MILEDKKEQKLPTFVFVEGRLPKPAATTASGTTPQRRRLLWRLPQRHPLPRPRPKANAGPPPRDRDRRPAHRARQHRVREGIAAAAGRRLPRPRRLDRDRHDQRSRRQPAAEHERREPQSGHRPAQFPAASIHARRRLADDPGPGGADSARRRRRAAAGRTQDDRGARQRLEPADSARRDRGDRRRDPCGLQSRRGGRRAGGPAPGARDPQRCSALLGRDARTRSRTSCAAWPRCQGASSVCSCPMASSSAPARARSAPRTCARLSTRARAPARSSTRSTATGWWATSGRRTGQVVSSAPGLETVVDARRCSSSA